MPHLLDRDRRPVVSDEAPGIASALNAIVAAGTSTTFRRLLIDQSGFPLADDTPSFLLFNQLIYRGAARPTDMADAIDVSRSYISRIVSRMEAAGLIMRAPDPDDDRSLIIALTDSGREIAQRVVQAGERMFSSIADEWSADDLATLERLIIKLARSMDTASSQLLAQVSGERWLARPDVD
jgi:DNA-binding MarR family transcriptional regulator